MQYTFSASGTPAAVRDSINSQAKSAGRGTAHGWPVAAAVRDYVNAQLDGAPSEATVSVQVAISATITGVPARDVIGAVTTSEGTREILATAERLDGQADVRGEDGLIHGDPVAIASAVSLAPVSGDPAADANVAGMGRARPERRK